MTLDNIRHTPAASRSREATLLATFNFAEDARRAADTLRGAGFDVVQVAAAAGRPDPVGEPLVEWGRCGYEARALDDKWTSAAAWDNALGLDIGGGTLLTAVVPEGDRARAAQLIKEAGGRL